MTGDRPLSVRLLDEQVVLARLDGQVVAFDDLCRHMGAALSLGRVVDGCQLQCAYHGWTYDAAGRCVDIPARRGTAIPEGARVQGYPAREAYGLVWVCLDQEPLEEPPPFPEFSDARFRMGPLRTYPVWKASAPRIVMGALDDTHFPWVHPGLLGDPGLPEPPPHTAWREEGCVMSRYTMLQPRNPTVPTESRETNADAVTYTNSARASSIRLLKESAAGTYAIFLAVQPHSAHESSTYWRVGRTFDLDPARDGDYEAFEDRVREQDQPIVESQRPWLLPPLSSRLLLYVRPADEPLIMYQQWLEELGIPAM